MPMKKIISMALVIQMSVVLFGLQTVMAQTSTGAAVGFKTTGRELKSSPRLNARSAGLQRVPSKAEVYGRAGISGESATMLSVTLPEQAKARPEDNTTRKAQALLIFSDSKKATNCIIEMPIVPGTVESFNVVAEDVPPMPYKSYGEQIVNAVAFNDMFMASTFCSMIYAQTNTIYNVSDWKTKTSYDYRAADLEATALTYNPADGLVYGVFQGTNPETDQEEWYFGKWVDPETYTQPQLISWLGSGVSWYALAASPDGIIYAIDGNCNLLKVDAVTGATSLIGSTGLSNKYKTSACYDSETNRILFATSLDTGSTFNSIDPATGRATMLYAMPDGEQIVGLFIPSSAPAPKSPAAPTDLKAEFELGSNSGNIRFNIPATYADGTPASGKADYEARLNGVVFGKGSADYGTSVALPLTMERAENGLVTVKLSNEAGESPVARTNLFLGSPIPRTPYFTQNLSYNEATKTFSLSWEPHSNNTGITGGQVENKDLTYELVRYPDGKVITTEAGVTTMNDQWVFDNDDFKIVYYELCAVYHGVKSAPARTRPISFGSIVPPYENPLMNSIGAAAFTYLPTGNDAREWSYISAVSEQTVPHGWMCHGAANSKTPMDSYLVLRGMKLEKGKMYTLSFTAACTNTSWRNERVAVYLGDEVSETGLRKQTLIEPTLIYNRREEDGEKHTCNFSVDKDGIYYLSFHHCSDPNLRFLYISQIKISAPIDETVPGEISNATAEAAAQGLLNVTLKFDMPAKTVGGKDISEPTSIRIERNGEKITDLTPNEKSVTYVDREAVNGVNNYVLTPFNTKGDGPKTTLNVFAGIGKPENPNPRAWYGDNDGEARITWRPSTKDEFGTTLNSGNVRYEIQRVTIVNGETMRNVIAKNIKDNSYVDNYCSPTAPISAVSYYVRAVTDGGNSQWVGTRRLGLGKPQTAPWTESFADGEVSYNWFTAGSDVQWGPITDDVYDDAKSVDKDNGFMICVAAAANSNTLLYSEPILIPADMPNPEISFYYFNQDKYQGVPVKNNIELILLDENGESSVKRAVCNGPWGWERMSYDMSKYRGKKVQIGVYGECIDRPSLLLDAFRLGSRYDNDIDMVVINGPKEVQAGMDVDLNVSFINSGNNAVPEGYKVELYNGDDMLAETSGPALALDAKGQVNFKIHTNPVMGDTAQFKAIVRFDADNNTENNISNVLTVKLINNDDYPEPQNLSAERNGSEVALEWTAPDMSKTPHKTYTEDFEKFESFAKSIPEWTIVDMDKGIVAPISNYIKIPESYGSPFAFFVQDNTVKPFNEYEEFKPYSGSKYMASQFVTDSEGNSIRNDDWLISPELSGEKQVASFMGKSISQSWPESFEVYYSTEGTDISDFQFLGGVQDAPCAWIQYTVSLPENARYFAIRCNSLACLQFMVDDVTLRLKSCDLVDLNLSGYNIYRDGVKINEAPVNGLNYVDRQADSDAHTYHVTALYKEGESLPSNSSGVTAGIGGVSAGQICVYGGVGSIVIAGADNTAVSICSLLGEKLYEGVVTGKKSVSAHPGVYVVAFNGRSVKVIVR